MKLSIITPVLNEPRVVRALDSIISQQHEHEVELIVVDGGSTDGTLDMLETRRNRIAVLVSKPDDGIYDGMNKGIGMATGDVIGILNADDQYSDPFVIRDVLQVFSDIKPMPVMETWYISTKRAKSSDTGKQAIPRGQTGILAGHPPIRHSSCEGAFMTNMAHSTPASRLRLTMN